MVKHKKMLILGLLSLMLLLGAFTISGVTVSAATLPKTGPDRWTPSLGSAPTLQSGVIHPDSVCPVTISQGTSHHDLVKIVQNDLNDFNGAGLAVDGNFGPKTKAAVINWQRALGLTVDGIVGPQTWRSFGEC